jgi:hypothetical protein
MNGGGYAYCYQNRFDWLAFHSVFLVLVLLAAYGACPGEPSKKRDRPANDLQHPAKARRVVVKSRLRPQTTRSVLLSGGLRITLCCAVVDDPHDH